MVYQREDLTLLMSTVQLSNWYHQSTGNIHVTATNKK